MTTSHKQTKGKITILHMYPNEMNIYGDFGNLLVLKRRLQWHGYEPEIKYHHPGKPLPEDFDLMIGGGGQDSGQAMVEHDLRSNGEKIRKISENGMPILMVCGLYQLFGNKFIAFDKHVIEGIGVFDIETICGSVRLVGNVITKSNFFGELIGYENHSGVTQLLNDQIPLAQVVKGGGNNNIDKTEGAVSYNSIGTYLHGSLLPKNPILADHLIELATTRKFGSFDPEVIDDSFSNRARMTAKKRPR